MTDSVSDDGKSKVGLATAIGIGFNSVRCEDAAGLDGNDVA